MNKPDLATALKTADLIHDRAAIDAAIAGMGRRIAADYRDERPLFVTVMNGGMMVAGPLAFAIVRDCDFDYVHATRYRGETSGGALTWIKRPEVPVKGRHVLLVDDILDEGKTLAAIAEWCRAEGAASVRLAVLCRKVHDRCVPGLVADYCGLEVPDRYVFGYGMDFHEQGRNLPAIYAI